MSEHAGAPYRGQAPPTGFVRLHLQGSKLSSSMMTPTVRINGALVQAGYGENLLPVWAGTNTIASQGEWMWSYGKAALTVDIAPGQVVDVWYAAPALTFIDGSMGFSRQKHRGRTAVYSVLGVLVALAVAVIIFAAMGG